MTACPKTNDLDNEGRVKELLQIYRKLPTESQEAILNTATRIADRLVPETGVYKKITRKRESEYNRLANRHIHAQGDDRPPTTHEINLRDLLTEEEYIALSDASAKN